MTPQDQKFFDAYKRLDKLCKEIYGDGGVSSYIDDMYSKDDKQAQHVRFWFEYRKQLVEMRRKRNILAHEDVSNQVSDPEDVTWLEDFRQNIMARRDPIALYSRTNLKEVKSKKASKSPFEIDYMEIENVDEKATPAEMGVFIATLLGTIVCVIGIVLYYLN